MKRIIHQDQRSGDFLALTTTYCTEATTLALTDFLLARLAEDEAAALAAQADSPAPWTVDPVAPRSSTDAFLKDSGREGAGWSIFEAEGYSATAHVDAVSHIARHDPAHVLAEVAAKRRIVDTVTTGVRISDALTEDVLRDLASVYADHPDFRQDWAA